MLIEYCSKLSGFQSCSQNTYTSFMELFFLEIFYLDFRMFREHSAVSITSAKMIKWNVLLMFTQPRKKHFECSENSRNNVFIT